MSGSNIDVQLAQLNANQYKSVVHEGEPLLILAGPGSGKTKVITTKIAWLIEKAQVEPLKILAMTFTNKAAKEMKQRVLASIAPDAEYSLQKPFISTFHSFGAYLLRMFHEYADLPPSFQIYDYADQLALIKEALSPIKESDAKATLKKISFLKDKGITHQSNDDLIEDIRLDRNAYRIYEKVKQHTGNVDFGDLLLKPYLLLQNNTELLKIIHQMWDWYLIDEYQDTNTLQFSFLYLLCKHTNNICVVGDDDQSIYKFRGAVVKNILDFRKHFSHAKIIHLEENYRSTSQILSLANDIISHNTGRYKKDIFSKTGDGVQPELVCFPYEDHERQYITELARHAVEHNKTLGIFFRLNSFSRSCETALVYAGIPYEILGATSFYEREEIKNALALLRTLRNTHDFISLQRIINKPTRGIGKTSIKKVVMAMKDGLDWHVALEQVKDTISSSAKKGMNEFDAIFRNEALLTCATVGACLQILLEESKLWDHYKKEDISDGTDRIRNLQEIINYAYDFANTEESWAEFFEQISLVEQKPSQKNANIQLMSLHRSKGLEFDMVLLCGLEDGVLPCEFGDEIPDYEEERRLLYVGITRAKKRLMLSYCTQRKWYGYTKRCDISPFLLNIDESLVKEYVYATNATNKRNASLSQGTGSSKWKIGQKVIHDEFGKGYITRVTYTDIHEVVEVEFTNEYQAMFIPKYTPKLKIENIDE